MPAYRPLVKVTKPTKRKIRVWPEGASEALKDCFSTTDWKMYRKAATYNMVALQEYTVTVAYIWKLPTSGRAWKTSLSPKPSPFGL